VVGAESKMKEEPHNYLQILPEVLESVGKTQQLWVTAKQNIHHCFLGKYHHADQLSYLEIFSASYKL